MAGQGDDEEIDAADSSSASPPLNLATEGERVYPEVLTRGMYLLRVSGSRRLESYYDRIRVVEELLEELRKLGAQVEVGRCDTVGGHRGWLCIVEGSRGEFQEYLPSPRIKIQAHEESPSRAVKVAYLMFKSAHSIDLREVVDA